ncbi:sulfatase-like hydrolase/transferase [Phycisphaeraceae bacterium D3-23]
MRTLPALFLLLCTLPLVACSHAPTPARPNILFISIDDLRPELGCYGAGHMHTPHIDALTQSGVAFDRCYVQVAVCNPSRASTLTGLRPDRLHVYTLRQHFRETAPDAVTLPQHLSAHGYTSHGLGKIFHNPWQDPRSWDAPHQWPDASHNHYTPEQRAFTRRVEETLPDNAWQKGNLRGPIAHDPDIPDADHFDGALTVLAQGRLQQLAQEGRPFFLAVGYTLPHLPWCPPRAWWDRYDRSALPLADNPYPPHGAPRVALGTSYELAHYADNVEMPTPYAGTLPEGEARRLRHAYYASVSFIDAQVGLLIDELDRLGLADDTIVVLWSDHGWKLGEHNAWGKMTNYELDTRIPMVIRDPRAQANGQRSGQLVESIDLYPTLCELAGVPSPAEIDGRSAAVLLDDPDTPHRDAAFSQYTRQGLMGNAIRTERWRYVEWRRLDNGSLAAQELYDHDNDPQENQNIVDDHPEAVARLAQLIANTLETGPIDLRAPIRSDPGGERRSVRWTNAYPGSVRVTWINPMGHRQSAFDLAPGAARQLNTFVGHAFAVESLDGAYHEVVRIGTDDRERTLAPDAKP